MEELRFDERVAIVTGAGGGLGRAHAMLLAARGAQVVVNDRGGAVDGTGGSVTPASDVTGEILASGGVAVADTSDVGTVEGGEALVDRAMAEFGRIDILVNNAGILRDKTLQSMTPEMFDDVLRVHLRGAYCVTKPAYVLMREQRYGRVITTTSPAGLYGNFGQVNYASAKMALIGFARALAHEGARYGVLANAISPSALTRMTEGLTGELGPLLKPELVSPLVAWLAHESCPVSGHVFAVGGGRVASVVFAETIGYASPTLTPEDVASHADAILDVGDLQIPTDVASAGGLIRRALDRAPTAP